MSETKTQLEQITLGAGCFWCIEAQFQALPGVRRVVPGYSGGDVSFPLYKEVCMGLTGHAEVVRVDFDPTVITVDTILQAFWRCHDPTQLNRQGNDVGTQYRSVIFYHNETQKTKAQLYKKNLNDNKVYPTEVVTEISPLTNFYEAEHDHQNYFNENGDEPYCQYVIKPKLAKFLASFTECPDVIAS